MLGVLTFVLAACGNSESKQAAAAPDPTQVLIGQVQAKVRAGLKDPDSARFGNIDVFPFFDGRMACGTVNAKNSFGGYVGDRYFSVGVHKDGTVGSPDVASNAVENKIHVAGCNFLKGYMAQPGRAGKAPTDEDVAELKQAYSKVILDVADKATAESAN